MIIFELFLAFGAAKAGSVAALWHEQKIDALAYMDTRIRKTTNLQAAYASPQLARTLPLLTKHSSPCR